MSADDLENYEADRELQLDAHHVWNRASAASVGRFQFSASRAVPTGGHRAGDLHAHSRERPETAAALASLI